jgi:hypothetical protein
VISRFDGPDTVAIIDCNVDGPKPKEFAAARTGVELKLDQRLHLSVQVAI